MLEKYDWEEERCLSGCRPAGHGGEIRPEGQEKGGTRSQEGPGQNVRQAVEAFDRLLSADDRDGAALCLEQWLDRFRREGNWSGQVTILNEMMGFYRNTGEKEKGLKAVQDGLRLVREHRLGETVSGGTTYVNAATTLKAFGRTAEAMPYYEQAFRVYGQLLDRRDYRFGGLFNNMALAWEELGEYRKAEAYWKQALEILERLEPGSIPELAVTWVSLACLYEKWEKPELVDECLVKAAGYFHSPDAVHDGYYAFNCRKCADIFGHFGYFRMCRELLKEAERIYGEGRPE